MVNTAREQFSWTRVYIVNFVEKRGVVGFERQTRGVDATLSVYEEGFANIVNSVYSSSRLFYNSFLKSIGLNK